MGKYTPSVKCNVKMCITIKILTPVFHSLKIHVFNHLVLHRTLSTCTLLLSAVCRKISRIDEHNFVQLIDCTSFI